MRLKISVRSESAHKSPVTCLGWSGYDEVYTTGDDGQLLSWHVSQNECTQIVQLNGKEIFPTDLQFAGRIASQSQQHQRHSSSSSSSSGDPFLLTSADGRFYLIGRSGRIERTVDAHKGAILAGRWSNDGTSLMTAGEDGLLKIWSRGGMLRSTLVNDGHESIYAACWTHDGQSIVYAQGNQLIAKELTPNSTPKKWIAHDGLVLCVSCGTSGLIVSGGEDCRYKVWTARGHPIYASPVQDDPIASVAIAPEGDLFAVGSYDSLRLCDVYGSSQSLEKPKTGCVYKLAFSTDGTRIAAACANGRVLFADILDRTVAYANYAATLTERKTIALSDAIGGTGETLELPERVVRMSMRYANLVVVTPSQCYVYTNTNWNTPNVFDLKGYVTLLVPGRKHMLLIESNSMGVYNYQGRLLSSPRYPSMSKLDALTPAAVALGANVLAVRDSTDYKTIYVVNLAQTKSTTNERHTTIVHHLPIVQLALDQKDNDAAASRLLAYLDNANDLYLITDVQSNQSRPVKIGGQVQSFAWNADHEFLTAVQEDSRLTVWFCPVAVYDAELMRAGSHQYDSYDLLGKGGGGGRSRIEDYVGNFIRLRRIDGAVVNVSVTPFPAILCRFVQENKWKKAVRLCRTIDDRILWTCLAVALLHQSSNVDHLEMAEESFAEIERYDCVAYLTEMRARAKSKAELLAGMALLAGNRKRSESILLQNGQVARTIRTLLDLYEWKRALDLAVKHKTHVDVVLYSRETFLKDLGDREETNPSYLTIRANVPIDAEKVLKKIEMERDRTNDDG